jgi:hypothetical protein
MKAANPAPKPLPIEGCKNIRPAGEFTVPSGPLAGMILPLYEMTEDPDAEKDADTNEH